MRKRNIHIQFWLNEKEAVKFNNTVKNSGISREAYLRQLVNGLVPNDLPPPDYHGMMRELRRIGNNLNQIAAKAHFFNVPDLRKYDENVSALNQTVIAIMSAVVLPRKLE